MSQYLIVTALGEEEPILFGEIETPVLCESKEKAEALLKKVALDEDAQRDWAVFELVDGRFQRRSVMFTTGSPLIEIHDKPYNHWTTYVRQHAGSRPRTLIPYVAFPPGVPTGGEQCVAEMLRYIEEATVLRDKYGATTVYSPESGDWFDEQ